MKEECGLRQHNRITVSGIRRVIILTLSAIAGLFGYAFIIGQLELAYHPRDHFIIALLMVTAVGGFLYGRACRQRRKL